MPWGSLDRMHVSSVHERTTRRFIQSNGLAWPAHLDELVSAVPTLCRVWCLEVRHRHLVSARRK